MKFKNISPLGDLDVPGVGIVLAGESFEVEGEQAASFERQADNFTRVDRPKRRTAKKATAKKATAKKATAKKAAPTPPPAGDGDGSTEETQ